MKKEEPMIVLLAVLKDSYERTHRLIEQGHLEDFDTLKALHDPSYWQAERNDILWHLKQVLPDDLAEQIAAAWHKDFSEEYAEALGEYDNE